MKTIIHYAIVLGVIAALTLCASMSFANDKIFYLDCDGTSDYPNLKTKHGLHLNIMLDLSKSTVRIEDKGGVKSINEYSINITDYLFSWNINRDFDGTTLIGTIDRESGSYREIWYHQNGSAMIDNVAECKKVAKSDKRGIKF